VEISILRTNIDDERDCWPESFDVAEILFGTNAEVGTSCRPKHPNCVGEVNLVGHEIFGMRECACGLRKRCAHAPELLVGQRDWRSRVGYAARLISER
jgi:hypothetical protein